MSEDERVDLVSFTGSIPVSITLSFFDTVVSLSISCRADIAWLHYVTTHEMVHVTLRFIANNVTKVKFFSTSVMLLATGTCRTGENTVRSPCWRGNVASCVHAFRVPQYCWLSLLQILFTIIGWSEVTSFFSSVFSWVDTLRILLGKS